MSVSAYLGPEGPRSWRFLSGDKLIETSPKGTLQVNDADVLALHARTGRGLVLLFDFLIAEDLDQGKLVTVLDAYAPPAWPIHALYPKNRQLVPKVSVLSRLLERSVRSQAPAPKASPLRQQGRALRCAGRESSSRVCPPRQREVERRAVLGVRFRSDAAAVARSMIERMIDRPMPRPPGLVE